MSNDCENWFMFFSGMLMYIPYPKDPLYRFLLNEDHMLGIFWVSTLVPSPGCWKIVADVWLCMAAIILCWWTHLVRDILVGVGVHLSSIMLFMVVMFAELHHITCFLFWLWGLMVQQVEIIDKLLLFGEQHLCQLEPGLGMCRASVGWLLTQKYVQNNSRKTVSRKFDRHY